MKFDFSKSTEADFRNKLQSDLVNLTKNVLYITYQIDKILKIVRALESSQNLQKQVDDYFEDDKHDIPEEDKEPD